MPNFTITDNGALQTSTSGPFGLKTQLYNSTTLAANSVLGFEAAADPAGGLRLDQGYLLANNESTEGWTLCKDTLGEVVVSFLSPPLLSGKD